MATRIPFAVLVIIPFIAASQHHPTDQISAEKALVQADVAYQHHQFPEARQWAQGAYTFFKAQRDTHFAQAAYQLGRSCFALQRYDTARLYFAEAAHFFPCPSIPCGDAWHYAARCAWETDQLPDAELLYKKGLEIRQSIPLGAGCDIAESRSALGDVYHAQSKYATAIEEFTLALEAQQRCSGTNSLGVARVRGNLGMSYLRQGDYAEARSQLEQCLLIQQQQLPAEHADIAQTLYYLGTTYRSMIRPEEAFFYYEKAVAIYEQVYDTTYLELASVYDGIGQYYLQQKLYEKALQYLQKMHQIMVFYGQTESKSYAFACASFGQVYLGLKKYPEAIVWFEKTVAIWRAKNPHLNSQLASMLTYLARARIKNNEFERGVAHFTEAIEIWEQLGHPYLPQGYGLLATAFKNEYVGRLDPNLLEKSRFWYKKSITNTVEQLRYETGQDALRKMLNEYSRTVFNAFHAEYLSQQRLSNDRDSALQNMWMLQEQVHGYQLLVAMQEAKARSFADIPDAERRRDSLLRTEIVALERQRMQLLLAGKPLDDAAVLTIDTKILAQKSTAERGLAELEQKYPNYTQQRYQRNMRSLAEIQEALLPGQTILSYMTGDSSVFAMVVQKTTASAYQIRLKTTLAEPISRLRKGIEGYYAGTAKSPALYEQSVTQYAAAAEQLYQTLIAPLTDALTGQIIIIPDGVLNELPFDALLTGTPGDLTNFGTYPFLVNRYRISYAYSGTTYAQVSRASGRVTGNGLLAMAPFYQSDTTLLLSARAGTENAHREGLVVLPYSGEEIKRIQPFYRDNARLFTGKAATREQFLAFAGQYPIVHLATHGYANRLTGAYSYLAFAPDAHSDGILTAGELYALRLPATLVVLSACETGTGERQTGEGVIGLVRAFVFAGAESVVASLWRVNDRSTMQLMHFFHEELNKGNDRQWALSEAKRRYISQNPGVQAHPYFWAAFTLHGATGVIGR